MFAFHVNKTIHSICESSKDGFLKNFHSLLITHDTLILATYRSPMKYKVQLLHRTTAELETHIHPVKSRFLTVNSEDSTPFIMENMTISKVDTYIYAETPISDAPVSKQVQAHMHEKQKHVRNFSSFLTKNSDAPFEVKIKTWNAAMSLLYFMDVNVGSPQT